MFSPPEVILRPAARKVRTGIDASINTGQVQRNLASSETYRAVVVRELKKPLVLESVSRKNLSPKEVRIQIHACAINFSDTLIIKGEYLHLPKFPFTPGSEVAGVISEVGRDVKNVKPGMRVIGILQSMAGGFAEEVITEENKVHEIPGAMSFAEAASLLVSYCTSLTAIDRKANLKKGETVLITAAAGALGLAAVDLAANVYGAKVIGAAGSDAKCDLIKSYGAFHTINYNKSGIRDEVKKVVPRGVDVVIEQVGGDAFRQAFRSLAPEARFIVIGFASGDIPKVPANHLLVKNVTMTGLYWGGQVYFNREIFQWSLQEILRLYRNGKIKPKVGATFEFDKINEAIEFVRSRKSTGKVVLTMR